MSNSFAVSRFYRYLCVNSRSSHLHLGVCSIRSLFQNSGFYFINFGRNITMQLALMCGIFTMHTVFDPYGYLISLLVWIVGALDYGNCSSCFCACSILNLHSGQ